MSEFNEKRARFINPNDIEWNCVMDTAKSDAVNENSTVITRKMILGNEPIEKIIKYPDLPAAVIDNLINEKRTKL